MERGVRRIGVVETGVDEVGRCRTAVSTRSLPEVDTLELPSGRPDRTRFWTVGGFGLSCPAGGARSRTRDCTIEASDDLNRNEHREQAARRARRQ